MTSEGRIASNYECPQCNERISLYEQKSAVFNGFEWRCRMGTFNRCLEEYIWRRSHVIRLAMRPSRLFKNLLRCILHLEKISSLKIPKKAESTLPAPGIEPRPVVRKRDTLPLDLFYIEAIMMKLHVGSIK
ncbi:hypothetical protein TNCV_2468911 [Trichonephila clavipes]|nr:hypothetical protein TNCV_2468911 [Trichonephila clavipes]